MNVCVCVLFFFPSGCRLLVVFHVVSYNPKIEARERERRNKIPKIKKGQLTVFENVRGFNKNRFLPEVHAGKPAIQRRLRVKPPNITSY